MPGAQSSSVQVRVSLHVPSACGSPAEPRPALYAGAMRGNWVPLTGAGRPVRGCGASWPFRNPAVGLSGLGGPRSLVSGEMEVPGPSRPPLAPSNRALGGVFSRNRGHIAVSGPYLPARHIRGWRTHTARRPFRSSTVSRRAMIIVRGHYGSCILSFPRIFRSAARTTRHLVLHRDQGIRRYLSRFPCLALVAPGFPAPFLLSDHSPTGSPPFVRGGPGNVRAGRQAPLHYRKRNRTGNPTRASPPRASPRTTFRPAFAGQEARTTCP